MNETNNYNLDIIVINRFVSFINFHNCFNKALTKKACNAGP